MKTRNWKSGYSGKLLAILLAGCAGAGSLPEQQRLNLTGFSPAFKQGYADGCESASARSHRRHEGRYRTEAEYMSGWNDGFSVCQRRR